MAAADVERHAAGCARCGQQRSALLDLGKRMREEVPYHTAPKALRRLAAPAYGCGTRSWTVALGGSGRCRQGGCRRGWQFSSPARCCSGTSTMPCPAQVVANHVRASLTGQRVAVAVSSDRHTVKPLAFGARSTLPRR